MSKPILAKSQKCRKLIPFESTKSRLELVKRYT